MPDKSDFLRLRNQATYAPRSNGSDKESRVFAAAAVAFQLLQQAF
jgi:hypothetical protein